MALHRPRVLQQDIAEVAIGESGIRIAVADDVECVESIESETHRVLADNVEVLEG